MTARRLFFVVWLVVAAVLVWACVGDDPAQTGPTPPDGGTSSSGGSSGTSGTSSSGGGQDSGDPDANGCAGGITCDGNCINPKTDKKHCGKCAHDCGNGDCTDGVCKQVLIGGNATSDGGAGSISSLTTDQTDDNPKGLAQRVFWTVTGADGGVFQDNVVGGNPVKLSTSGVVQQTNVVVDQTTVYWQLQNFGGAPQPVVKASVNQAASQTGIGTMNGPFLHAISYDPAAKNVIGSYKATSTTLGSFKCGPTNGTVVCAQLGATFSGTPGSNIAIDNANMYYADIDFGVIYREALTGGNSSAYKTTEATPTLLRVDGQNLFWSNSGDKKIQRGALASPGTIVPITTPANAASGLAADAVNVYWTDSVAGILYYTSRTGTGTATPYVTLGVSSSPMRLVRDTGFLYFTHNGGIYRVALP